MKVKSPSFQKMAFMSRQEVPKSLGKTWNNLHPDVSALLLGDFAETDPAGVIASLFTGHDTEPQLVEWFSESSFRYMSTMTGGKSPLSASESHQVVDAKLHMSSGLT